MRTADPATGQQSYGKVARTFVGEVEKILEVETADGARVTATEGHPFFVEGRGFIAARKLARGDLLRRVDGRRVAVVGLGWEEARTRVYNFEVEGTHTYYAAGVWVHNATPCGDDIVVYRVPRADQLDELRLTGQMSGAGPQGAASFTPDLEYAQWYSCGEGVDVWTTTVPKAMYDRVTGAGMIWFDHGRGPGGWVINIPPKLARFYPDFFSGWTPLGKP